MCGGKHRFLVWSGLLDTRNCISSSAAFMAPPLIFVLDRRRVQLRSEFLPTATCVSLGECQKDISSHPGPNARKVFADDKTDREM